MYPDRWHVEKLRDLVRENYDEPESLIRVINSVSRYIGIFVVHLVGARDTMKPVVGEGMDPNPGKLKYIFGAAEDQNDFMAAKLETEAHFLGFVHSARSIFDVFAFLVNKLLLNSLIPEDKCYLDPVLKKLPDSELKNELNALKNSSSYSYVVAFVNTSKHRYLIDQPYVLNIPEGRVGIRISRFEYKGESFPEYWIEEALELVLAAKNRIIACGNALNAAVLEKV
ncbi:hypothetical protein [Porticoccus sp.]